MAPKTATATKNTKAAAPVPKNATKKAAVEKVEKAAPKAASKPKHAKPLGGLLTNVFVKALGGLPEALADKFGLDGEDVGDFLTQFYVSIGLISAPRNTVSGYNVFSRSKHEEFKEEGRKFTKADTATKEIERLWGLLSEKEKAKWNAKGKAESDAKKAKASKASVEDADSDEEDADADEAPKPSKGKKAVAAAPKGGKKAAPKKEAETVKLSTKKHGDGYRLYANGEETSFMVKSNRSPKTVVGVIRDEEVVEDALNEEESEFAEKNGLTLSDSMQKAIEEAAAAEDDGDEAEDNDDDDDGDEVEDNDDEDEAEDDGEADE